MAIQLLVNDNPVDLLTQQEVPVVIENPIFKKTLEPDEFTRPFKLPLTSKNRVAIDNQNRLDSTISKPYESEIIIDGFSFKKGKLTINRSNEKFFESTFEADNEVYTTLSKTKVNEIGELLSLDENANSYKSYEINILPIFGLQFYRQYLLNINLNGKNYNAIYNYPFSIATNKVQKIVDDINIDYPGAATRHGHDIHLDHLNLYQLNVTSVRNFEIIEKIDDAVIDQDAVIQAIETIQSQGHDKVCFPLIYLADFYSSNETFKGFANVYIDGAVPEMKNEFSEKSEWYHTYIPCVFLTYILNQIPSLINRQTINGGIIDDPTFKKIALFNNATLDNYIYSESLGQGVNSFQGFIDMNRHLPSLSVLELMEGIMNDFSQYFVFDKDTIFVKDKQIPLTSEIVDWSNRLEPSFNKEHRKYDGLTVSYEEYDDDSQAIVKPLIIEGGEFEHEMHHSTIITKGGIGESIFSGVRNSANNNLPPIYFFYNGLRNYSSTDNSLFPMGSPYESHLGVQLNDYSLLLNDGFYDKFLSSNLTLAIGEEITVRIKLNIGDILSITSNWDTPRRKISTAEGDCIAIIKKIEFTASNVSEISTSSVTLVRQL